MHKLPAKYLLKYTTKELWDILIGDFILVFEDGEIETNYRETLFSSYAWDLHRNYPDTPLLCRHHLRHITKGNMLKSNTHINLLNNVLWDVVDTYHLYTPDSKDHVLRLVYEAANNIYNDMSYAAEEYITSIDILDFVEIIDTLESQSILNENDYSRENIQTVYSKATDVLMKNPELKNNSAVKAIRTGIVKMQQVTQCVAMRGSVSDVDGSILPVPITRGYVKGTNTLYNLIAESRSGAKSLYYAGSNLQDAEFFARRLQILCMTVENLHPVDCGSTEYLEWRVKEPVIENDRVIYEGDLRFIVGKYYLDETTNTLKVIKDTDKHLHGKVIKMRSAIYCKHPDPHGVCMVCFGMMSDNVTSVSNLGHNCAANMSEKSSQSIMSIKHLDASIIIMAIQLNELSHRYFNLSSNKSSYLIKDSIIKSGHKLVVAHDDAFGLTDILIVRDIRDMDPARISRIEYVGFEKDGIVTRVRVSSDGRNAMLSTDFLCYLHSHKWTTDSKGNYVFDLSKWNPNTPILVLPDVEYSYAAHSSQIASLIESKIRDIGERVKPQSPALTLSELFILVNSKITVHLSILEIVIYASMCADPKNGNYDLARNSPERGLGVSELTIKSRSLGPFYAYKRQRDLIVSPMAFYSENRPDSVFDVMLKPREVVEHYKSKNKK